MLKVINETVNEFGAKVYEVEGTVKLAMDSIWDYQGPNTVNVSKIIVDKHDYDDYTYTHLLVEHNAPWEIYTDSGFPKAISEVVGFEVGFTEQGMQENGLASMES